MNFLANPIYKTNIKRVFNNINNQKNQKKTLREEESHNKSWAYPMHVSNSYVGNSDFHPFWIVTTPHQSDIS